MGEHFGLWYNSVMVKQARPFILFLQKRILWLARHWEMAVNGVFALVLAGAIAAPLMMSLGWTDAARWLYRQYAPHDHQLPQRSYFLFSPEGGVKSYSLDDVLAQGANRYNLRAFWGNTQMGWKMAMNHRMVAIFIGLLAGGLLWSSYVWQPRISPALLVVFVFPMFFDALSHMADERLGTMWRTGNLWSVWLTHGIMPPEYYSGTTIGTINWWMRTVTGFWFGLGTALYLFPYFDRRFTAIRRELEPKLRKIKNMQK